MPEGKKTGNLNNEQALREKVKQKLMEQASQESGVTESVDEAPSEAFDDVIEPEPSRNFLARKAKSQDISMFFRELAILLETGYPLLRALKLLASKTVNRSLSNELQRVAAQVEAGGTLAKALRQSPKYFTPVTISMIEAAEATGKLKETLTIIAMDLDNDEELTARIRHAMSYPMLTLVFAIAASLVILLFVIPSFAEGYTHSDMELPFTTALLVSFSQFLSNFWWLWLPALIVLVIVVIRLAKANVRLFDSLVLRIPIIGEIVMLGTMMRFSNTLRVLLDSDVPILESLKLARGAVNNSVLKQIINEARANVQKGKSLSQPFSRFKYFPPMLVDMMTVGEESGKLPFVLEHIFFALRIRLNRLINNMTVTLGPIMTMFVGLLVLVVVLMLFIPYFDMLTALSNLR